MALFLLSAEQAGATGLLWHATEKNGNAAGIRPSFGRRTSQVVFTVVAVDARTTSSNRTLRSTLAAQSAGGGELHLRSESTTGSIPA